MNNKIWYKDQIAKQRPMLSNWPNWPKLCPFQLVLVHKFGLCCTKCFHSSSYWQRSVSSGNKGMGCFTPDLSFNLFGMHVFQDRPQQEHPVLKNNYRLKFGLHSLMWEGKMSAGIWLHKKTNEWVEWTKLVVRKQAVLQLERIRMSELQNESALTKWVKGKRECIRRCVFCVWGGVVRWIQVICIKLVCSIVHINSPHA